MRQTYDDLCSSMDNSFKNTDLLELTKESVLNGTRSIDEMFGTPLDSKFLKAMDED